MYYFVWAACYVCIRKQRQQLVCELEKRRCNGLAGSVEEQKGKGGGGGEYGGIYYTYSNEQRRRIFLNKARCCNM